MDTVKNVIAFDAGGGSVRVQQIGFDGGKLQMQQLARFDNGPITAGNSLYWDILGIYKALKEGLQIACSKDRHIASAGIDTWGNDHVFLDKSGYMLENPYSHRDKRTEGCVEEVNGILGGKELFFRSGIQQVRMNTLYQLFSVVRKRQYLFDIADKLLFLPDLLAYYLTGELRSEYTMATISQLYSYDEGDWDLELMSALGIQRRLFSPVIMPGMTIGSVMPSVCDDIGIRPMKLIAVGSHDTASAIAAVPSPYDTPMYISSGTWSIVGTETDKPVINMDAYRFNCSNEGGVNGKIRLLKNVMGLWIMQEVQRRFLAEGRRYSFEELNKLAAASKPFGPVIDPDAECFYEPSDMPAMIREYCSRTGQPAPEDDGALARVVLESLAFKYRYVVEGLEKLTGRKHECIHIVGGGSRNGLLNSFTADCCGRVVHAGPTEATALGNGLVQLVSLGELADYDQARAVVKESFPPEIYLPKDMRRWDEEYRRFLDITGLEEI